MNSEKNKILAVIGDEDTCVGFLLGGIGEKDLSKKPTRNFLVVDKNTTQEEVAETFQNFVKRPDVAIILITQHVAETIRDLIDAHTAAMPSVVEIPSKDSPFNPEKDSVLKKARAMFTHE